MIYFILEFFSFQWDLCTQVISILYAMFSTFWRHHQWEYVDCTLPNVINFSVSYPELSDVNFCPHFTNLFPQLTMNDFSVHRIIGRGGFGEVYGCRKADTGKMYAMKCLDKKRIKMKQGETLALNERIMLSLVSTGVSVHYVPWNTVFMQSDAKDHVPFMIC